MTLSIPKLSLVVLIGPSGSGKSTFARKHFRPTEILSSDFFRGLVSDDENDQSATNDAFETLHYVAAKRLARGHLTVIDATNVQKAARDPLVALARKFHCLPVAIVLNVPEKVCLDRNRVREDRNFGPHVVRQQRSQLRLSIKGLKREGFRHIHLLNSVEEVASAAIQRVPLWNDKRDEHGPFDIIGDVHGCADELEALLQQLGYQASDDCDDEFGGENNVPVYQHPEGRKAVFVGDLVDRGPRVLDTVEIVRKMVAVGSGHCVPGNHDVKFVRKLNGRNVQMKHGLEESWQEVEALPHAIRDAFCKRLVAFLDGLVSHYVFDDGKLVVAHAGLREELQGRGSGKVREFCLYGEPTGETDEYGFPERYNWAAEYRGSAAVVYGHTPVADPQWLNHTVCIDTGCVFGGKLTALRYPEREFVSIPAKQTYCETSRPFLAEKGSRSLSSQQQHDDLLDASDVIGKRIISTRLLRNVIIRDENSTAALEVMSRFAVDPRWLIYLPPTMSPCETSNQDGMLEHPAEAFSYFRGQGIGSVVCEEKHMGSRAVMVVCRDEDAARERFGVDNGDSGCIYTRTGRPFFSDPDTENQLLARVRSALTEVDFWNEFGTHWACLDCELMPWSAKAQELLRSQYAAVGAAGRAAISAVSKQLAIAANRLPADQSAELSAITERMNVRGKAIDRFTSAYRQYCWPVTSLADYKLAPFHLLATEGKLHTDQPHTWHMQTLARICRVDEEVLLPTPFQTVDLSDNESVSSGTDWWNDLTGKGGEGMVIKPLDWMVRGKKGMAQPAVKCRGKEYLRIIYGPDYDSDENLPRLKRRSLGRKRSLALREFALGIESLERFIEFQPLRAVHECVFGILALESEPVDPRL